LNAREIGAQEAMLLCLAREFGPVTVKAAALAKVVANVEISAQAVNREKPSLKFSCKHAHADRKNNARRVAMHRYNNDSEQKQFASAHRFASK
jgi:hypothetical protein